MLQNYIDLLKDAIDRMSSLGNSGAGISEYLQAVGYEFAVIGLGLLYIAGFIAIFAVPIFAEYKLCYKETWGTKCWREFARYAQRVNDVSKNVYEMSKRVYDITTAAEIHELCLKIQNLINIADIGIECPDVDMDKCVKIAKIERGDDRFEKLLKWVPNGVCRVERSNAREFYVYDYSNIGSMYIRSKVLDIFKTDANAKREYKKHEVCRITLGIVIAVVYLLFAIPFVLMLF